MGKLHFISKKDFAISTALGVEFALIMCLGAFGGWWLDKKADTFPLFLFVGSILAFALALYVLVVHAKALIRRENKK